VLPKVHEQYLLFIISCSYFVYSHLRVHFYDFCEQHTIGSKLPSIHFVSFSHGVVKVTLTNCTLVPEKYCFIHNRLLAKSDNELLI